LVNPADKDAGRRKEEKNLHPLSLMPDATSTPFLPVEGLRLLAQVLMLGGRIAQPCGVSDIETKQRQEVKRHQRPTTEHRFLIWVSSTHMESIHSEDKARILHASPSAFRIPGISSSSHPSRF